MRHHLSDPSGQQRESGQHDKGQHELADEQIAYAHVTAAHARKTRVEQREEVPQRTSGRLLAFRPQQQRAQGGAERQRVERGDDHRKRDGQRELTVERTGDSRHESGRDENRGQHQRNPDQRAADLIHGFQRRLPRRAPFLDLGLDRFHNHDRVVDHQADG